jgi:phosphoserine aminotransferase
MEKRVINFSPGPATLPLPVLQEAQRHLLALPGVGASVLEVSHRSRWFDEVLDETVANIRRLLGVPANYQILFMHGGASSQFSLIPMNFLRNRARPADYIVAGSWGEKALREAQREAEARAAWNGKGENYVRVPRQSELELTGNAAYVHFTSNETIQGVQFRTEPEIANVPLLCDASSDLLSRPIAIERYALIYAGAQKNLGPAGVTVVIIRDDMLEQVPDNLHAMFDYRLQANNRSVYNTPAVFSIYIVLLVTRWLLEQVGGLERMAAINQQKAQSIYGAIDRSGGFYRGHVQPDSRSLMNVTWRLPSEPLEQEFVRQAELRGLCELKGHRSVGGIRASLYNAMTLDGALALRDFMLEFQEQHARGRAAKQVS